VLTSLFELEFSRIVIQNVKQGLKFTVNNLKEIYSDY